jgi:uncharacterized protein (TIGR03067 family)
MTMVRCQEVLMWRAVGVALFVATFGAHLLAGERTDPDEKDLVGNWVIESAKDDGSEDTPFKGTKLTFEGGRIDMQFPDGDKAKGTYKLDASKKPKAIDFGLVVDQILVTRDGVYSLENDTLTICLPASYGGPRPEKLDGSAGSKCWLWRMKKVK